ncbi:hypothetical protein EQ826_16205 [Ectopseudomonas mendocina]|nr:hypothetical protein EQ826_16205 [Pseudomonas mendocina]
MGAAPYRKGQVLHSVFAAAAPFVRPGDVIVRIDSRYFRPAEVDSLLGDPSKAKNKLGWVPEITVQELCAEMVAADLLLARQHALLTRHGYTAPLSLDD